MYGFEGLYVLEVDGDDGGGRNLGRARVGGGVFF